MSLELDALYRRYAPMVMRRCRFLLKDEDEAADAMQETFIRLMRVSSVKEEGASSFIYVIATNVCFSLIKKNGKRPHIPLEEDIFWEDDHTERLDHTTFLDLLFTEEKTSTQTMALLHYVDRLTLEETASIVNMSVSGVRKRLRNLRQKAKRLREKEK